MLPDFRVLVFATVSTFVVTAAAGLFASARLLPEPMATIQPDRDTPINRIALSWQDVPRTPVREITPAALVQEAIDPKPALPEKSEDRPEGLPLASSMSPEKSRFDETIIVKSVPPAENAGDAPATTGTIVETPKQSEIPAVTAPNTAEKKSIAARPEPSEETKHIPKPPAAAALPARPKATRARAEQRSVRRQPVPRRTIGSAPAANAPETNFFTDFGSRVN